MQIFCKTKSGAKKMENSNDTDNIEIGVELEFWSDFTDSLVTESIEFNSKDICEKVDSILKEYKVVNKDITSITNYEKISIKDKLLTVSKEKNGCTLEWSFTIDSGVFEIIINKMPFKGYKTFAQELQSIYTVMTKLGYTIPVTGPKISMTHINVDFYSGFNGDCFNVFEATKKYEDEVANPIIVKLRKILSDNLNGKNKKNLNDSKAAIESITENASTIDNILMLEKWEEEKEKIKTLAQPLTPIVDCKKLRDNTYNLLLKCNKTLYDCFEVIRNNYLHYNSVTNKFSEYLQASGQKRLHIGISNDPNDQLHYRAVNIEHLIEKDESLRRVEFRCFLGKQNYNDTYEQIESLCKLINSIKQ
jgi:hypothetical protein